MYSFSARSQARLATCDTRLQDIFNEVIRFYDCSILEGHRDKETQEEVFRRGLSKVEWPTGKHNCYPSLAVDVAPYPIDWKDTSRFCFFAGIVMGVAAKNGQRLRWGGDWNRNGVIKDETFLDYVHFELMD